MLVASVVINLANVIGRYLFHTPIAWAEEIMLYLMIGAVFLTCPVVGWSGGQIRMDAFVSSLPQSPRKFVATISDVVMIAASLLLVYLSWPVVGMLFEYDQRSSTANIPLFIPQAMMPLGFLLTAVLVAVRVSTSRSGSAADPTASADPQQSHLS